MAAPLFGRQTFGRIGVLLCGSMATAGLGFVLHVALARGLSLPSYGQLGAMLAAVNVLTPFASCNVGWLWLQVYGSEGWAANRWIDASLKAACLSLFAATIALLGYVVLRKQPLAAGDAFICLAVVPLLLGQALADTTSTRLQLEERYVLLATWQLVMPLGRMLAVAAIFAAGYRDLLAVLFGFALVAGIATAISLLSIGQMRRGNMKLAGHRPLNPHAAALTPPALRQVFATATPYMMMTTFYLVYSQGIVAVVDSLLGPADAALYNVSFLILSAVYLIPATTYTKFLPGKIFRWWVHDRQMFDAALHVGVAVQLVLGILSMAIVLVVVPLAVPVLFGERYGPAIPIIMISALAIPIRFVQHVYASAFYSSDHVHRKMGYMGLAAAISVIVNLALTPRFGLYGAAISAISAELSLLVLFFWGAARYIDGIDVWSTFRLSVLRESLAYIGGSRERASRPNADTEDRSSAHSSSSEHGQSECYARASTGRTG
jgi:O-antigen/teichoic acid export membrane protein